MRKDANIGDKLYLYTPCSSYYVSMVKNPYTVVSVSKTGNECIVQACKLYFAGPCYYDTIADEIREDPNGKLVKLRWNEKRGRWQESPAGSYPRVAVFGRWEHQPYLD